EIRKLDLRIGDRIALERSGEVIPKVVRVLLELRDGTETPIEPPSACPGCAEPLDAGAPVLRCRHDGCRQRRMDPIPHAPPRGARGGGGGGGRGGSPSPAPSPPPRPCSPPPPPVWPRWASDKRSRRPPPPRSPAPAGRRSGG